MIKILWIATGTLFLLTGIAAAGGKKLCDAGDLCGESGIENSFVSAIDVLPDGTTESYDIFDLTGAQYRVTDFTSMTTDEVIDVSDTSKYSSPPYSLIGRLQAYKVEDLEKLRNSTAVAPSSRCSAFVIGRRILMTAAHCFDINDDDIITKEEIKPYVWIYSDKLNVYKSYATKIWVPTGPYLSYSVDYVLKYTSRDGSRIVDSDYSYRWNQADYAIVVLDDTIISRKTKTMNPLWDYRYNWSNSTLEPISKKVRIVGSNGTLHLNEITSEDGIFVVPHENTNHWYINFTQPTEPLEILHSDLSGMSGSPVLVPKARKKADNRDVVGIYLGSKFLYTGVKPSDGGDPVDIGAGIANIGAIQSLTVKLCDMAANAWDYVKDEYGDRMSHKRPKCNEAHLNRCISRIDTCSVTIGEITPAVFD